jgi:hypothetical protein
VKLLIVTGPPAASVPATFGEPVTLPETKACTS